MCSEETKTLLTTVHFECPECEAVYNMSVTEHRKQVVFTCNTCKEQFAVKWCFVPLVSTYKMIKVEKKKGGDNIDKKKYNGE